MYYPDAIAGLHNKILKQSGLEHIRLHDLQHTSLTLQSDTDPKTLSGMLSSTMQASPREHAHIQLIIFMRRQPRRLGISYRGQSKAGKLRIDS